MKAGDRIRVDMGWEGMYSDYQDFTVENFRYCLGIFASDQHREAGKFTPICDMYERGPESKTLYICNFGEYTSNLVQGFSNLPK